MSVTELDKVRARQAVHHAIEKGKLVAKPCENCSGIPAQAHHDDYRRPLAVRWLCTKCHTAVHQRQKHPLTSACSVCGTVFTPHPTKRARQKTCSTPCANTQRSRTESATKLARRLAA